MFAVLKLSFTQSLALFYMCVCILQLVKKKSKLTSVPPSAHVGEGCEGARNDSGSIKVTEEHNTNRSLKMFAFLFFVLMPGNGISLESKACQKNK